MIDFVDTERRFNHCYYCKRLWDDESLQLELCPDCYEAAKADPDNANRVRLDQLLKYGHFRDENMIEAVRLMWMLTKG